MIPTPTPLVLSLATAEAALLDMVVATDTGVASVFFSLDVGYTVGAILGAFWIAFLLRRFGVIKI
jgi:hypothetical protein